MNALTIGKVAKQAAINIDTVRFYEREGLLPEAQRSPAGYRLYSAEDVARLCFIRRAKQLGFSLEEIAELLSLNAGKGPRASVKRLAERRLADIDQKLRELAAIRAALGALVTQCSGKGAVEGCPIIKGVLAHDEQCKKEH